MFFLIIIYDGFANLKYIDASFASVLGEKKTFYDWDKIFHTIVTCISLA